MKKAIYAGLVAISMLGTASAHAATVFASGTVENQTIDYITFGHAGGALSITTGGTGFFGLYSPAMRLFTNDGSAFGALTGAQQGPAVNELFSTATLNLASLQAGYYILAIGSSFMTETEGRTGVANTPLIFDLAYNTSFNSATAVTIGAIPEPATWAMMIAGFGLVGASMRRRAPKVTVTYA